MSKLILAIDPGQHIGWALGSCKELKEYGVIQSKLDFPYNLVGNVDKVHNLILLYNPSLIAIESVQPFNQIAIQRGDLFKLSKVIGAIIYVCQMRKKFIIEIPPVQWKGQIDKKILNKRIREKFNLQTRNEHILSAIGLWDYVAKNFKEF